MDVPPLSYNPQGELIGVALIRYVNNKAEPLRTFRVDIVYPGLSRYDAYWVPINEFDHENPYPPPITSIDLTRPALVPPEDGVFFFSLQSKEKLSSRLSVVCIDTLVRIRGPYSFGIGQCEEVTSYR